MCHNSTQGAGDAVPFLAGAPAYPMDKKIIHQLHADFERCAHTDEATGIKYWLARDLQKLLGYSLWRKPKRR